MNFIGIDVSKQKLDCTLLRENVADKPLHKTVPNTAEGVAALLVWTTGKAKCGADGFHVILEATGPYHEIAAEALFHAVCKVSVVNPAYPRHFAKAFGLKTKNDRVDATILAQYGQKNQEKLTIWQPPPQEYRQLQQLQRRKQALEADLQRERNRLEKLLAGHLDNFGTDSIARRVAHLEAELALLDQAVETLVEAHPALERDRGLLQSVKGVGAVVSTLLLPVLQPGRFDSAPQAAAYLGLVPVESQSGTSVKSRARLSKAGDAKVRAKLSLQGGHCRRPLQPGREGALRAFAGQRKVQNVGSRRGYA